MKAVKIIGHPVLLMSIFLLLIIEGENFGGFYLLYLLMAIPHGGVYALVALVGLISVFSGYKTNYQKAGVLKPLLYLAGLALMLISLVLFFEKGNKWDTFRLFIPLLSFILFGISSICFLIHTSTLFKKANKPTESQLTVM